MNETKVAVDFVEIPSRDYFRGLFNVNKEISALLLLLTLGLSFLKPTATTPLLPFFGALSLFLCWRYQFTGLAISLISTTLSFFSLSSNAEGVLWQLGLHLSFSLVYFIAFSVSLEAEKKQKEGESLLFSMQEQKEALGCDLERLEVELKKWREEAKQRRIDKQLDEKKFSLLQNDLELSLKQKQEIIEDANEARGKALKLSSLLDEVVLEKSKLQEKQEELASKMGVILLEKKSLEEQKDLLLTENQELKAVTFKEASSQGSLEVEKKWMELKLQHKQLGHQFEEKSTILSQTRKELFQVQGILLTKEQAEESAKIDYDLTEINALIDQLSTLEKANEQLLLEVTQLEQIISHIL